MNATMIFDTLYGLYSNTFGNPTAYETVRTSLNAAYETVRTSIDADSIPLQDVIFWTGHVVYGAGHSWHWMFQKTGEYGSCFNEYGGYLAQAYWLHLTMEVAKAALERIYAPRKQVVTETKTVVSFTAAQLETILQNAQKTTRIVPLTKAQLETTPQNAQKTARTASLAKVHSRPPRKTHRNEGN